MRIDVTKDWCLRMAELEADEEIGVGLVAVDPVFDGESVARRRSRRWRLDDSSR